MPSKLSCCSTVPSIGPGPATSATLSAPVVSFRSFGYAQSRWILRCFLSDLSATALTLRHPAGRHRRRLLFRRQMRTINSRGDAAANSPESLQRPRATAGPVQRLFGAAVGASSGCGACDTVLPEHVFDDLVPAIFAECGVCSQCKRARLSASHEYRCL